MCGGGTSAVCANRQVCLRVGASQFGAWGTGERAEAKTRGHFTLRRKKQKEGLQRSRDTTST